MQKRIIAIGMTVLLLGSVLIGCKRQPTYSMVTDDLVFDKNNKIQGMFEIVRVNPGGTVVLNVENSVETTTIGSVEFTKLSTGVKARVIASDAELQTATIRVSVKKKNR